MSHSGMLHAECDSGQPSEWFKNVPCPRTLPHPAEAEDCFMVRTGDTMDKAPGAVGL